MSIVQNGFKLITYNVNGQAHTQLFDLNTYHLEMHNLADERKFQHKVESMSTLLNKTMKQLDDFCKLDKPRWGYPQKWTDAEVMKLNQ